eukprot:567754-Pelagomonas_calceolata.AAC.1
MEDGERLRASAFMHAKTQKFANFECGAYGMTFVTECALVPLGIRFEHVLFYLSWVLLRNIWYPYLTYIYYREWQVCLGFQLMMVKHAIPEAWNSCMSPAEDVGKRMRAQGGHTV